MLFLPSRFICCSAAMVTLSGMRAVHSGAGAVLSTDLSFRGAPTGPARSGRPDDKLRANPESIIATLEALEGSGRSWIAGVMDSGLLAYARRRNDGLYCAGAAATGLGLACFFGAAGAPACAVVFSSGGGLAASAEGDVGVHGPAPAAGFFAAGLGSVGFAVVLVSLGLASTGLATTDFFFAGGSGAA